MTASIQDAIEREITVRAPKERVFKAIVEPTQITGWFPDSIEGNIAVGESPVFDFGSDGKARIYVTAVDPHDYFAYRWVPTGGFLGDVLGHPNTLVEFRLQEVPVGTLVKLKESGFASLPADVREQALKDNSGGWDYMINRLEALLNQE